MSEIEKLMQSAGIKKVRQTNIAGGDYPIIVGFEDYPPFTADKQLSLIKWLAITRAILIKQNRIFVGFETGNPKDLKCSEDLDLNFEETLAGLINTLWQDLTEEEKAEIKEILK